MSSSTQDMMEEALGLLAEGKLEAGIKRLRAVVAATPDCAKAWGHLAWHLALADRHEEALEAVERVVDLQPENIEARWRRGDRLARLGRIDEAETAYRAALDADSACIDAQTGLECVEWLKKEVGKDSGVGCQVSGKPEIGQEEATWRDENESTAEEHFEKADTRLSSLPHHLHIETSTRCNCACITCAKGHAPYYAEDLQAEVFAAIQRDLLPTATRVNLTGSGEPLLGPDVGRFYDAAAAAGARVYFVTNTTLLTMRRIAKFARRPTDVIASIDGATPEIFESIRRPSKFDRVISTLRRYKKMRDIYPEVGSTLGINFVAMRRNIEELPALVDLAAGLGAQFIAVLDFATGDVPPEVAGEHLRFSPDLANRMFDEASERAKARGITLHVPPKFGDEPPAPVGAGWFERLRRVGRILPEPGRFPQRCPDPWKTVLISTSGLVHPCCASRRVMGDLKRQAFADIWNGRTYRRFRRWNPTALPPPECRQCNQLWGVNAGNPSAVRAKEGLIVKVLYRAAATWHRLAAAVRNRLAPPPPPPKPNYAEGRPIRNDAKTSDTA